MTIVGNFDEAEAGLFQMHRDPRGVGVESVLDQLLDDRCRPLDHLAGGDAVDHVLLEDSDVAHFRAR